MNFKKLVTGLFITGMVTTTSLVAFADTPKISESTKALLLTKSTNVTSIENSDIKTMNMIPLEKYVSSVNNTGVDSINMEKLASASVDTINLATGLYIDGKEITFEEIASGILKDETKITGITDKNGNPLTVKTDENGLTQITDKDGNPAEGVVSNVISASTITVTENRDIVENGNINLIKLTPATK